MWSDPVLTNTIFIPPAPFYTGLVILGLAIGSFLNVVIYRLPRMLERAWKKDCLSQLEMEIPEALQSHSENLLWPPSHCPTCNHRIHPFENIPLISYAWLKGRCRHCHTPIPWRYPAIELLTMSLTLVTGWRFGPSLPLLFALLFTWMLITMAVIDWETYLLPDVLTMPLLWLGLLVNAFGIFVPLRDALFGAIAGYLSLWLVFHIYKQLTGKEGFGYGDFKLLAAFGAWGGWLNLPLVILFSACLGTLGAGVLLITKKLDSNRIIPFGPFIALAAWVGLLWGHPLTHEWLLWVGGNPLSP